jgi:hypothetical protein
MDQIPMIYFNETKKDPNFVFFKFPFQWTRPSHLGPIADRRTVEDPMSLDCANPAAAYEIGGA